MIRKRSMRGAVSVLLVGLFWTSAAHTLAAAGPGRSDEISPVLPRVSSGMAAASNREWRLEPVRDAPSEHRASSRQVRHRSPRPRAGSSGATRLTAGLALGVLGFFGGGLAGAVIAGKGEAAMGGFMIGAPIGAGAGVAIGMLLAR